MMITMYGEVKILFQKYGEGNGEPKYSGQSIY